jgi:hypothetical protein
MKNETAQMTSGQTRELIAAVIENLPTDLSADVAQGWIGNKKALKKGLRELLMPPASPVAPTIIQIDRSKPFDPVSFIGAGWKIDEEDDKALTITEVDLMKVHFETTLKPHEEWVKGEEKLKRLKELPDVRLDARVFQTLWDNQHLIPELWKKDVSGNIRYIYFDGTILRGPGGFRGVLYLGFSDGQWYWRFRWLDSGFNSQYPSAVLAS